MYIQMSRRGVDQHGVGTGDGVEELGHGVVRLGIWMVYSLKVSPRGLDEAAV